MLFRGPYTPLETAGLHAIVAKAMDQFLDAGCRHFSGFRLDGCLALILSHDFALSLPAG